MPVLGGNDLITLLCPNLACRSILKVPPRVRGKRIRCGKCGTLFVVPVKNAAGDASASSPSGASPPVPKHWA